MLIRIVGLVICLILCAGWSHGRGPLTFYVSNTGNDSNDGRSPANSWRTPSKVNSSQFNSGDTVAFDGGSTFTTSLTLTQANAPGFLTLTSYNSGQPTFNTGNSAVCITALFFPGLTINNFNCVGGGSTTSTTEGVHIENKGAGDPHIAGPTLTNNTISQYGLSCVNIQGTNVQSGFNIITVNNNTIHDCGANATIPNTPAVFGLLACVQINGSDRGVDRTNNNHIIISGNVAFNCIGTHNLFGGMGAFIMESTDVTASNNIVHDSGSGNDNSSGPVGIIFVFVDHGAMRFNEVYNMTHGVGGSDGEGLDMDVGTINSSIEYNYSHNNTSNELLCFGCNTSKIRFNIAEATGTTVGIGLLSQPGDDVEVYNNTVNMLNADTCFSGGNSTTKATWTFANNICVSADLSPSVIIANSFAGSVLNVTGNDYNLTGNFTLEFNSISYNSLTLARAAGFETVTGLGGVGTGANPGLNGTFPAGVCGGHVPPCPLAYQISSTTPTGKGTGLNLNTIYGFNVGTQDFYGNVLTAGSLPIGAAGNK